MRLNQCIGIVGVNRTGKSSTALEIAKSYKKRRNSPEIWGFDPQNVFSKILTKKLDDTENFWDEVNRLKNGLLILDELKLLLPYPQHEPKGLKRLLSRFHNDNVDILFVCHNPSIIPTIFTFFTTYYLIFLTFSVEGGFKKKIPNYLFCETAAKKVNEYVQKNGRGLHVKDPNFKGQKFPYAVFDCEKLKIQYKNFVK